MCSMGVTKKGVVVSSDSDDGSLPGLPGRDFPRRGFINGSGRR